MGQEFFINSQELENKIRKLLPSQGGAGAGFDLSASTQIVPIIDVTESAEGSNVRADLQTSLSLASVTSFSVSNTTSTIITTTGYFRIFGTVSGVRTGTSADFGTFSITDGVTTKILTSFDIYAPNGLASYDFNVFLTAGDSVTVQSTGSTLVVKGCSRQIADIDGNLVNP